jgi:hypothetical protein
MMMMMGLRQQNEGANFHRRPFRTHGQCTHTLKIKNEENNNLQEFLMDFVACFCHFGGF